MNVARTQTNQAARRAPRPGAVLAALAAAQFTVMLATSIVNVALPQIRAGVGLSDGGTTWVVNAYGLAFGALLLAGGRAADLLGRRRVLIAGLALFAAASLAAGLATAPGVLIAARAVQGLGAAAIAPAALALAMDLFPPGPGRGRALGVWGAVSGAGGAGGVLLGGVLTQAWGWPWIFHSVALGAALVLAAVAALVPRAAGRKAGRFDLLGTATVTLALTCLVWGLTTARGAGWTDARVLGALGGRRRAARGLRRDRAPPAERTDTAAAVHHRPGRRGQPADGAAGLRVDRTVLLPAALPAAGPRLQPLGHRSGTTPARRRQHARRRPGAAPRPAHRGHRDRDRGPAHPGRGLLWLSRISAHGSYLADLLGPSILIGLGLSIAFVQLTALAVDGVPPAGRGPGRRPGEHHPPGRRRRRPRRPGHPGRLRHRPRVHPPAPSGGPHRRLPHRLHRLRRGPGRHSPPRAAPHPPRRPADRNHLPPGPASDPQPA